MVQNLSKICKKLTRSLYLDSHIEYFGYNLYASNIILVVGIIQIVVKSWHNGFGRFLFVFFIEKPISKLKMCFKKILLLAKTSAMFSQFHIILNRLLMNYDRWKCYNLYSISLNLNKRMLDFFFLDFETPYNYFLTSERSVYDNKQMM